MDIKMSRTGAQFSVAMVTWFTCALTGTSAAWAEEVRAAAELCANCTPQQRAAKAVNQTDEGAVYIFDRPQGAVYKFIINTELVEEEPYTVVKSASVVEVEADLADSFRRIVEAEQAFTPEDFTLPPDFPIKTVAGALLDSVYLRGQLSFLFNNDKGFYYPPGALQEFWEAWQNRGLNPLLFGNFFNNRVLDVILADGSTVAVGVKTLWDLSSSKRSWTIERASHFKLADGEIPPTGRSYGWDGLVIEGDQNAMIDWTRWAMQNEIPIAGWTNSEPAAGRLSCTGKFDQVRCTFEAF